MLLGLLLVVLAAASYLFYNIFAFGWPIKSGFDEFIPPQPKAEGYERAKTLWDWMQLFIIPLVLAIAAFVLNRTQQSNTEKATEQRARTEQEIAERRAQDAVLETYIDRMAELLIDKNLRSQPTDEARDMARIRTLTALRRLDGARNQILIQFLHDAGLLGGQSTPIIDISGGDLRGVDLEGAYLEAVNLKGANLLKANLQDAFLKKANLQGANLEAANLQRAYLEGANLREATLRKANLHKAKLHNADLEVADLREANLQRAYLLEANLSAADLERANLRQTDLRRANLQRANLLGADLYDTNLADANLTKADLQEANLRTAFLIRTNLQDANLSRVKYLDRTFHLDEANLKGATMPDGSKHE
jgi:uncharacterized protein YjbI with pentapeptide repeats